MIAPHYKIDVDIKRRFVRLTLSGFWDRATFDRYTQEVEGLAREAIRAGRVRQDYRVLLDLRNHGVQSREIAAEIEAGLIRNASPKQRHAVLISDSALHKSQVQRLGSATDARLFENEQDALAWLLEAPDSAA
ncbi:STAS/SEC14 domain-containing protein [Sphingomonas sp. PAMC 26605]|uniref:STAS/SEC14 domain-containing protein n=1 Tax=Sphingomonas sp. PAMC 26605 TaxID=1112214 RepID=UPI00026CAD1F|nr:STAS/SEC14 domain-containing protein [Sphingomonas sp. PAMC 26605]